MAQWNKKGAVFNRKGTEDGFTWNSRDYIKVFQIGDTFYLSDNISSFIARFILTESNAVSDRVDYFALFDNLSETFYATDTDASVSILFTMADSFGVKDDLSDFVVLAFLNEKVNLLEDLKTFAQILANDSINVKDIPSLEVLFNIMEDFGFKELKQEIETFIATHDELGMTDHEPRQAISDFLIGAIEDDDKAFDWLIPFDLRVDWRNTKIQVMPEAEITSIEMPGFDGEIVADTTYKDRLFNIVAFSNDRMTVDQKENLKHRITQILDSTKHQTKKLTIQARSTTFDVKYEGQAEIVSGPSYVKGTIPLHVTPYGYEMFERELYGSGLVDNSAGDTFMRPVHTISGPVTNPAFKLGIVEYVWNGSIPEGTSLVIDHDKMTCYTIDNLGQKINALAKLTGDFQSIKAAGSVVLVADENTENHILTTWRVPVLW